MIPFLPTPYKDELLFSVLGRYHIWSRNFSSKDTVNDLFGRKTASAVIDLPNNVQRISEQLPKGTINTPERLIQNHTLFPLFKPFLPKERVNELMEKMKNGGDIHTTIGVMASSISPPKFLRYCPGCYTEDINQYGEPYWHRTHQVPGVEVCPIHSKFLINSNIKTSSRLNKHVFDILDYEMPVHTNTRLISEKELDHYKAIAEAVYWLLNNEVPVLGLEEINKRYVSYLKQMNLTAPATGSIRQKDFIDKFISYYGVDFLEEIGCPVTYRNDNWLTKLVRKPRTASHPIKHISLLLFMGLTPEEFFKQDTEYHPFGQAPWICLNAASDHFKQPVIYDCKVTRDYKTSVPVGTFACSCGFVYSRRGPDKEKSDRFKRGRIKEFGPIWIKKLIELSKAKGLRETARILDVDPGTVKNQLEKLTNPDPEINLVPLDSFEDQQDLYRTVWERTVQLNEGLTKTELRKIAPAAFVWLYRYDREWLADNSPKPLARKKYKDSRVDWEKRDKEIATKIMQVVKEELTGSTKKPVQLTISMIGKGTGYLSLLQRHLSKLPLTQKVLNEAVESLDDFQIRRVNYVADQIREREELVRVWMIVREAGLRPGYSERVQKAIRQEIEKEMSFVI